MTELAAIRPDDWNLPLFLHVLGALALIGAIALTAAFLLAAGRARSGASLRLALRTLGLAVLPAWVVLRVSAEWIADKEGLAAIDDAPDWIGIGYMAADAGLLLIAITALVGWLAYRRTRDGGEPGGGVRAASVLVALLLVLNVVALWAMTAKPG